MKNDEYQFPKDEYLEQSDSVVPGKRDSISSDDGDNTQPPDGGDQRFAILRNKKFLIGLLIFIVIIVGLKLMHSSSKTATPVVQEQPTVMAALPAPAPTAFPSQNIPMPGTVLDLQNRVSEVHDQLSSVVAANAQLTQSVSALTAQVATLAAAVQDSEQKLAAMTIKPAVNMKKPLYYPPAPVIYVLKAVVPGRAWLIGSNGISVNVSVGSYLSNYYGAIRAIDANSGQVYTARGKVITYGTNDS